VFAVLADPTTHSAIDGTGWVEESVDRAPLTEWGRFSGWRCITPTIPTAATGGQQGQVLDRRAPSAGCRGRRRTTVTWSSAAGSGVTTGAARSVETEVTLTYDWSAVPRFIREYLQFPPFGPEHLPNSLRHLAELAAPKSRAWTAGG